MAEVDREGRFPEEAIGGAPGRGDARSHAPHRRRRARRHARRLPRRHAGDRVAMRVDGDDLPDARLRRAGHARGERRRTRAARWPPARTCPRFAFSERGSRSYFWAPVSQLAGPRCPRRSRSSPRPATRTASSVITVPRRRDADRLEPVPRLGLHGRDRDRGPRHGLGLRGNASAPMTFDVEVSDGMLLGEAGKGSRPARCRAPVVPAGLRSGLARGRGGRVAGVAHVTSAKPNTWTRHSPTSPRSAGSAARRPRSIRWPDSSPTSRADGEGDPAVPILSAKASANEMAIRVTSEEAGVRRRGVEPVAAARALLPGCESRLRDGSHHRRALRADRAALAGMPSM